MCLVGLLLQAHSVTLDHQPERGLTTSPNTYRTACAEVITGTYTQLFKGCRFLKQNLEWEETQPHSHRDVQVGAVGKGLSLMDR